MKNAKLVKIGDEVKSLEIINLELLVDEICYSEELPRMEECDAYWFNSKGELITEVDEYKLRPLSNDLEEGYYFKVLVYKDGEFRIKFSYNKGNFYFCKVNSMLISGRTKGIEEFIKNQTVKDKKTGKIYYQLYDLMDEDFNHIDKIPYIFEPRKLMLFPGKNILFEVIEDESTMIWPEKLEKFSSEIIKGRQPIMVAFRDTDCNSLSNIQYKSDNFSDIFQTKKYETVNKDDSVLISTMNKDDYEKCKEQDGNIDFDLLKSSYHYTSVYFSSEEPNALIATFYEMGYYTETIFFFEGFDFSRVKIKKETKSLNNSIDRLLEFDYDEDRKEKSDKKIEKMLEKIASKF